ncbi:MAG: 4-alpha-glucanotransferase [Lachnospiraceae bacterium]|nr:4-alpha-glucanotransferase [Lachnospiraceae bacterium]
MGNKREAGILMPIFSLPGKYGIGCFSKEAYKFVDFLVEAKQSLWQILPLGPTSYGDSPYQSFSTFAGNPYFIDLETLVEEGLLTKEDCEKYDVLDSESDIKYGDLYEKRFKVLRISFENFKKNKNPLFEKFIKENSSWLEDYALFMAVKATFGDQSLAYWDEDIRKREPKAMKEYKDRLKDDVDFYMYLQFKFDEQWKALKEYANKNGVKIVGDIPIYVSGDSSDVWAEKELFEVDEDLNAINVAGCPPDGFAVKGQLWGNPLYAWPNHKKTNYDWWKRRIRKCAEWYDVIRIDHFRGFDAFYSIDAKAEDAVNGKWRKGPGKDLFKALKPELEKTNTGIIAEDLGFMTESVKKLVKDTGFPNMKVLEFAFDVDDTEGHNDFLPFNYSKNCIAYTGTHDNSTVKGWLKDLDRETYNYVCKFVNANPKDKNEVVDGMVREVIASPANLAVIPMQDYLHLDDKARINIPSTLGENWRWRMKPNALTERLALRIADLTVTYSRVSKKGK